MFNFFLFVFPVSLLVFGIYYIFDFFFCFVLVWVPLVSVPAAGPEKEQASKQASRQASNAPSAFAPKDTQAPASNP